jgi:hypothetical protein
VVVTLVATVACGAPSAVPAQRANDLPGVCPLEGQLTIRDALPPFGEGVLLIADSGRPVRSALSGHIERVRSIEGGPTAEAEVTVRSGEVTMTYGRGSGVTLPPEGRSVEVGQSLGLGTDMLWMQATRAGEPLELRPLLDEWGCRESLPMVRELRTRLLDGTEWVVTLAEPVVVAGSRVSGVSGRLEVDGNHVADVSRHTGLPDLTHPEFAGADPPQLVERFNRHDDRRAELWNMAPNDPGTFSFLLWIEGDGDHVRITSGSPPEQAELIATSLRFEPADHQTGAIWFESKRVSIEALEAVFFLTDPADPLTGPQVRLASSGGSVDPAKEPRCSRMVFQGPILTDSTRHAVEGAMVRRVGCAKTEMIPRSESERNLGEDALGVSINEECGKAP